MFANLKTIKKHKREFRLSSESGAGITLIEIVVVIFIIALFSLIIISDFPTILKQFALSRITYKLAQDLRKTEDLGLSGVQLNDSNGDPIPTKGYGIYININSSSAKYIIYADVADAEGNSDRKYNDVQPYNCVAYGVDQPYNCCDKADQTANGTLESDCVIEVIDVSKENSSLYIKQINNIIAGFTSVNFSPPNPTINIANISSANSPIGIVLSNGSATREVKVNTSGLIYVQ